MPDGMVVHVIVQAGGDGDGVLKGMQLPTGAAVIPASSSNSDNSASPALTRPSSGWCLLRCGCGREIMAHSDVAARGYITCNYCVSGFEVVSENVYLEEV